jgi:predicted permease
MAALGEIAGSFVAYWCMRVLGEVFFRWNSTYETAARPPAFNFPLLLFSGVLTILTAVLFGVVPAWRLTRADSAQAIREGEGRLSHSRSRLGKGLVVVQVALSLVLLVAAGLFLQTLRRLQKVNVGFNPEHIALFTLQPGLSGYDRTRAAALFEQVEQRLLRMPGIRSVSFVAPDGLLHDGQTTANIYVESDVKPHQSSILAIHPGFFDTMEIPLRLGRKFTAADNSPTAPWVAIVNEAFVRKFFNGGNPIGKHFAGIPQASATRLIEIVGVVADAKVNSLREPPPPMYYRPMAQIPFPSRVVVVRTAGDPEPLLPVIRDSIHNIEPRLPVGDMSTQAERIGRGYLVNERMFAIASTSFGGLALLIAMIGLFGLMSYGVARRTKEIGIRIALGARRDEVLRSVLREGLFLVGIGVITGLVSAAAMTRLISSLLFGIAPYDPITVVIAVALMTGVSTLAAYLPARRAADVDPMIALRHE